jgi:hypothetical protein
MCIETVDNFVGKCSGHVIPELGVLKAFSGETDDAAAYLI